jgi:hypothetical protein
MMALKDSPKAGRRALLVTAVHGIDRRRSLIARPPQRALHAERYGTIADQLVRAGDQDRRQGPFGRLGW